MCSLPSQRSYSKWWPVHLEANLMNFVQVSGEKDEKDEIKPKKYVIMTDVIILQ